MKKWILTTALLTCISTAIAKPNALELAAQSSGGTKAFQLKGKHARQQLVATA